LYGQSPVKHQSKQKKEGSPFEELELLVSILENIDINLTSSRGLKSPEYQYFQSLLNLGSDNPYEIYNHYSPA
jgi:hypothetical protein